MKINWFSPSTGYPFQVPRSCAEADRRWWSRTGETGWRGHKRGTSTVVCVLSLVFSFDWCVTLKILFLLIWIVSWFVILFLNTVLVYYKLCASADAMTDYFQEPWTFLPNIMVHIRWTCILFPRMWTCTNMRHNWPSLLALCLHGMFSNRQLRRRRKPWRSWFKVRSLPLCLYDWLRRQPLHSTSGNNNVITLHK